MGAQATRSPQDVATGLELYRFPSWPRTQPNSWIRTKRARRIRRLGSLDAGARQVSSLDHEDSVIDTGTQSDETPLRVFVIPFYGGGGDHRTVSYGCPTVFGVPAYFLLSLEISIPVLVMTLFKFPSYNHRATFCSGTRRYLPMVKSLVRLAEPIRLWLLTD